MSAAVHALHTPPSATSHAEQSFPPSPLSASQARRWTDSLLPRYDWLPYDTGTRELATAIVSELITNAYRHGAHPILNAAASDPSPDPVALALRLTLNPDELIIHCEDPGPGTLPSVPPAVDAEHGRGLLIILRHGARLSTAPTPTGCRITAVLPRTDAARAASCRCPCWSSGHPLDVCARTIRAGGFPYVTRSGVVVYCTPCIRHRRRPAL